MFPRARKVSLILAPHGSAKSWNKVVSLPALVVIGAALVALIGLLLVLLLQVADLSARAREVGELRIEKAALETQVERVEELQAELTRLQEFETRIRRWAGIESAASAGVAAGHRWEREEARLAEVPSLSPLPGWVSRSFEPGPEGHPGIDLVQETGTPVLAAALGIVRLAGWDETYGNLVVLDHGNGFTTVYGHNESLLVREGDLVPRGETIARLGNTGRSSAPHLHFEIRLEEEPLDPTYLLSVGT